MKKLFVIIVSILVVGGYFFFFPESQTNDPKFVSLENGGFRLQGKPFYPIAINYVAALGTDGKEYWPSPLPEYGPEANLSFLNKDSSFKILQADFEMIRQMGFNTVRFTHIGEINREYGANDWYYIKSYNKNADSSKIVFKDGVMYIKYLKAIDELVQLAKDAGLKIILLVKMHEEVRSSYEFLENILTHFNNEPAIFAYDLFNEPLYFHKANRSKKDIHRITNNWQKFFKHYAPDQLSTIGLTGIREVFEWDPNILGVDFISFHPYDYEPNQIMNEIYWYGKYVNKPWIIGETSFSANDDSIKYTDQNKFAEQTLKQVCDCGGKGYSWWQYKDVKWGSYHSDYMGIVNWNGTTINKKGHTIFGTVKPLEKVFQNYIPKKNNNGCIKFDNYYNLSEYKDHRILGTIIDDRENPIEGAVIMGWDKDWNKTVSTVSKKDGTFELFSNFIYGHWITSATNYSTLREGFWHERDSQLDTLTNVTNYNLGKLKLTRLF